MISVKDISKSYDGLKVLKDITLEINRHEITSIIGASGAGKSTLLQLIGTLDRPTSGTIEINGVNTGDLPRNELAKFRNEELGFVFQFHHLLPEFSAIENIILPGLIAKKQRTQLVQKAHEWLGYLKLDHRGDHKPSELSGGEQQRVAIARALINEPSIILADEPSGNLDSKNAEELHNLFHKLRDDFNQTLVIVTHNKQLADASNRVIELKDGNVVDDRKIN